MNHQFIIYHPEKNQNLNVVDIITIVAFLSTVIFFVLDKYINSKNNLENYINRLLSLKLELNKNTKIISTWIKELEKDLNLGNKIIYFRYDTLVSEHIIASGELLDSDILRNLDAILTAQKQINLILDGLVKMGETSHVDSKSIADLFKGRIISSSKLILKMSEELDSHYPRVINDLSTYIEKQKNKRFLCIINYYLDIKDKEIDESFWKDAYLK